MRKYYNLLFVLFSTCILISSCKKDKIEDTPPVILTDKLSISVIPVFGNESLFLDSTYVTDEGYEIQFTDVKFFGGNWKNGNEPLFQTAKFDFRGDGNNFVTVNKKPTNFASLQGLLGVDVSLNHLDPTAFADEDPLNITNSGDMHWSWNPGYIFIKIEARVDTIQDGIPLFDHYAVYHVGTDEYIQTLDFPVVNWVLVSEKFYRSSMKLDLHQFLSNPTQPIDVKTEFLTHTGAGQEVLTLKAIENFKAALSFVP